MQHICTLGVPKYQKLNQCLEDLRQALDSYNETGSLADKQTFENRLAAATDQLIEYENWLLTPIMYRDQLLVTSDALVLETLDHSLISLGKLDGLDESKYLIRNKHVSSLNIKDHSLPEGFDFSLLRHLPQLTRFICSGNRELRVLPQFFESLEVLSCNDIGLEAPLDYLPKKLRVWDCSNNPKMGRLPELHEGLIDVCCTRTGLTHSPRSLPMSLKTWDCSYNPELKDLPILHEGLTRLECIKIGLATRLISLPKSLLYCDISSNPELRHLPRLQVDMDLRDLYCDDIGLVDLPDDFLDNIPRDLEFLFLTNNPLSPDAKEKLRRLREERGINVTFDE